MTNDDLNAATAAQAHDPAEPNPAEPNPAAEEPTPQEAVMEEEGAPPIEEHTDGTARLVIKRSGAETDTVFNFSAPAVIGRFDPGIGPIDVDMAAIPEGSYVSRKHAKITHDDGEWMIHDLGSSNGTFVLQDGDFQRVEIAALEDGTEIALGNARMVFRLG